MRLQSSPFVLAAALLWTLGWGPLDRWFGDDGPAAPSAAAIEAAVAREAADGDRHPALAAMYRQARLRWTSQERRALVDRLAEIAADGIDPEAVAAAELQPLAARLDAVRQDWAAMEPEAREAAEDPRPSLLGALDVQITDALLQAGDALLGRRVLPDALHRGTWFASAEDSLAHVPFRRSVASGDAPGVIRALDEMRPRHPEAEALRAALGRLRRAEGTPIPDGTPLRPGERSIRVPHLRARLAAFGYLADGGVDSGWEAPEPYAFDAATGGALARFRASRGLAPDTLLDAAATRALNADLDSLIATVELNLERWRWLPDDFGERHVFVNLAAYHLEVREPAGRDSLTGARRYRVGLEMPVNIGSGQTTGWTTPVISDSITSVIFRPAWYVPRSLVESQVVPMARADSLSLWRQGFEVTQNGAPVDSRLVKWDSVSTAGFRFMQRPGPSNPLGRVKFPMTNPYAILIHDTNRDRYGTASSSGCLHAGEPEALAAYLLEAEGWSEERVQTAYRRGPQRQGVRLEAPVRTHFVYLTATVDEAGALLLHDDPYGYDRKLAAALAGA